MSGVNRFVGCLSTAAAGLALGAPSALAESTSAAPAGGFDASSVSGAPEGLAVYQNGMRIHEALGNTANWDLTPTTAVRTIDVISNNPAFGLNALGGARNIQMKDAFTFDGPVSLRTTGLYVLDTFDVAARSTRRYVYALQSGDRGDLQDQFRCHGLRRRFRSRPRA
jgi:hypothetical protein